MREKVFYGSMKEYNRCFYLAVSTFIRKPKSVSNKIFKYKKDRLVAKFKNIIVIDGKKYCNVRYILEAIGISACAFWKWKSCGRLNSFNFIKFKRGWYISKKDVNRFVGLLVAKSQNYYWNRIGGKGDE